MLAARADTSTRTVYRVLETRPDKRLPDISLDLADRLCLAADAMLADCDEAIVTL